ncbi:MAG: peroxide stress protein YaaA [Opitutae bacterium]|nr:peroxide stress protein YaaA [Opitutae bacterium]
MILLSPAKTLDFENPAVEKTCTEPEFLSLSKNLIAGLSKMSNEEISKLMGISVKLAALNSERYKSWNVKHESKNSKQAILAFKGDVYEGMKAWDYTKQDFTYAQKNLRLLSGLYGLLRPLDLIQPHRLEMGTVYANPAGKDLYAFWGERLNKKLNEECKSSGSKYLINLASQEYFKATQPKKLEMEVISPVFKDEKNGKFKIISFYAKKARGMMGSFLIRNQVETLEGIRAFNDQGYQFESSESTNLQPVFLRSEKNRIAA